MTPEPEIHFRQLFKPTGPQTPRLQEALAATRPLLPTPLERLQNPDLGQLKQLLDLILDADDNQAVIELAHRLTSQHLRQLFPMLVFQLLSAPEEKEHETELISRMNLIIRERACPSLYQMGWLTFQLHYELPEIGQMLSLLCSILNIRRSSGLDGSLPLISDVLAPDSRTFVRKLLRRLDDLEIPLQQFLDQHQLDPALPLGTALISQAFLKGSETIFVGSHRLFGKVLAAAELDLQTRLLKHFFRLKHLDTATYNSFCQTLYRQIGPPEDEHPVWTELKAKHRLTFRNWVTAATIGSHCRSNPDKARLYLHYLSQIQRLEAWDNDTLFIYMPGFILVDYRPEPDFALYYDQAQAERRLLSKDAAASSHPASPTIPRRRVDEAIRRASSQGIVGLPFDQEGRRYTRIFLDFCLQEQARIRKKSRVKNVNKFR